MTERPQDFQDSVLEHEVHSRTIAQTSRLWLIFFLEPDGPAWWARVLRPGFRHLCAVSRYDSADRWLYFHPARTGTSIQIFTDEQIKVVITDLLARSSVVLRVASRQERRNAPAMVFCVAEIKALLGIRSRALTPYRLYRDLIARGAEIVHQPCVVAKPEAAAPSVP